MLVPVVDAGLNLRDEGFERLDLITCWRTILDGAVFEESGEDGFLNFGEAEDGWRWVGEDGFKLKILATKYGDLFSPRLWHVASIIEM